MPEESTQGLRADAARNVERIVKGGSRRLLRAGAGRAPGGDRGAGLALNVSTPFRRFPDRRALVRAALLLAYEEYLEPRLEAALRDDEPYRGLISAFDALMEMGVAELRAARRCPGAGGAHG